MKRVNWMDVQLVGISEQLALLHKKFSEGILGIKL